MMNRRAFAKHLLTAPVWMSVLSAAAESKAAPSGLDNEVDDLLRRERLIDTAAGDRFYRHPAEKPLNYNPDTILPFAGGGVMGINHLVEEVQTKFSNRTIPTIPGEITHISALDGAGDVQQILREFECARRTVAAHADKVAIVGSAEEMARVIKSGKVALVLGLDTGNETAGDPLVLAELHRLGLRKMAMTHEAATPFCGSNSSEPKSTPGLTPLGRVMVAECNRLGVMIDVSHCSDITFWGVLENSRRPVIATHSGARARPGLFRRNLDDDMLRALAKNGGMVGIGGATERAAYDKLTAAGYYEDLSRINAWMLAKYPDRFELADALRDPAKLADARRSLGLPKVMRGTDQIGNLINPESTLVHLDYVANLIGFDHVGIGTDLEMYWRDYPPMLRGIAAGMLQRNYSSEKIRKIFSGNILRLFGDNPSAA